MAFKKRVKVPVIMQMEALECGAACLAMTLAYFGKWLPLEQVRSDCGVSRDGAKAKNIAQAARAYGLSAQGYRFEPEQIIENASYPCIIHWNFNHFVVLCGLTDKWAYLNDPAKGEVKLSREVFDKSFTGVCIAFGLTDAFEKGGKPASVIDFAKKRLKGTRSLFAFLVLLSALVFCVGVLQPTFARVFADVILPGRNDQLFLPFLGLVALGIGLLLLIQYLQAQYLLKIEGKLAVVASAAFIWRVLRLPMTFFAQRQVGDLALRQSANEGIAYSLLRQFAPFFLNCVMVVLYLIIMIRYSLTLTLVGIAALVINALLSRYAASLGANISRARTRDLSMKAGVTIAGIQMIETLKASGAEDGFFEKWSGHQAAVNAADVQESRLWRRWGTLLSLIMQICSIVVLITGIYLCFSGQMTVGLLFAFQAYMAQFSAPALTIISINNMFAELRVKMEWVADVMRSEPDVPEEATEIEEYDKLLGNIELKDVTFGYSRIEPPLIEGLSLSITSGQRIAIVGASGCGKSTVAKLINGLYDPWSGSISYDGKPREAINRNVFTSSIASVDQEIVIFGDTVASNIKMWDESIEDFEMIMAARDGQMHTVIMEREGGYAYRMAEGGRDFSGGQCQRLEIARALAADPTVIILDEATSALDAKTEFDVMRSISERGVTCIVIAHRLSTIRDCDEIIVLERGKIAERGTHEQLMQRNGAYALLVTNE